MLHRHKWEFLRLFRGEFTWTGGLGTNVFYRCSKCNKIKTNTFSGWLYEEDFKNGK